MEICSLFTLLLPVPWLCPLFQADSIMEINRCFMTRTVLNSKLLGNIHSYSSYDIFIIVLFIYVQACSNLIYMLAIGMLSFNFTINNIDYYYYRLYTYINNSMDFSCQNHSILVLCAQQNIWLPINLTQEWQHSPTEGLLLNVVSK